MQSTIWLGKDLEKEVEQGIWYPCVVSKEVIFKPRDRMGTQRAKPLWAEIMELLGGDYRSVRDKLYGDKSSAGDS